MRRKKTLLESNLESVGYKLSHKTYCGKKQEKVNEYVFYRNDGVVNYKVNIDRTRDHINSYSFNNKDIEMFNDNTIEHLIEVNDKFHKEMESIYDFDLKKAKEISVEEVEEHD